MSANSTPAGHHGESSTTRLVAGALAVGCWLTVLFALILAGVFVTVVAAGSGDTPEWLIDGLIAIWHGASLTLATRLAVGVLRRRSVEQVWWLAGLSVAELAIAALTGGVHESVWPTVLQGAIGIGGSIAAVTMWVPARRPLHERR